MGQGLRKKGGTFGHFINLNRLYYGTLYLLFLPALRVCIRPTPQTHRSFLETRTFRFTNVRLSTRPEHQPDVPIRQDWMVTTSRGGVIPRT
jgi:hypothetical protein